MQVPDAILVRLRDANPVRVTPGNDVGVQRMPAILDELQIFGLFAQFPGGLRSATAAGDTKGQSEQADLIDPMLFNHPFDSHDEPVTAFPAIRRETFCR